MKHLPFEMSSAPEIFQRTMTELLRGIDGMICYFDDIFCHTSTMEEHELLLGHVFKRLKEVGLQLNPEKCEYRKSEIPSWDISSAKIVFVLMTQRSQQWST